MPYKSKRTRDLQGEVKAGSGISVIVQTKPDGTKEYTITNGDPASAITVDGTGLSLISNVLRNTMAAIMGWSGDDSRGAINWTDDNGDTVLKIIPLEELFIGDAHDNNDFIIKHINGENRLIRGTLQIAENINSTGGVSLNTLVSNVQTLADMSNSAAMKAIGMGTMIYDGICYGYMSSTSDEVDDQPYESFYIDADNVYSFGGNDYSGITIQKTGLYRITLSGCLQIDSTTSVNEIFYRILLIDANGNRKNYKEKNAFVAALGGDEYITETNDNIYMYVEAGESLTFEVQCNNTDISDIYARDTDPLLTIQKVR